MPPLDTLGWRLTGLRNRVTDHLWERRLGIRTVGSVEVNQPDANRYATFAYTSIRRILGRLRLSPADWIVDIGCGKGRVICCAALHDVARVIGVDIDAGLCAQARQNAAAMRRRRATIEVVHQGAAEFDYSQCTRFVLFNSFGPSTLRSVLESIERSLRSRPRAILFAYINPFHDNVLAEAAGFQREESWRRAPWSGLKFDVSFWSCDTRAGTVT